MQILSKQIDGYLEKSSWIRKMFEAGAELKAKHGEDAVCDLSLGNPDVPPPAVVADGLHELADTVCKPLGMGYMPNPGYPHVREALANWLGRQQEAPLKGSDVILTVGAAGGLNCLFKAVLEPGEEVMCPAPFFVEYVFYVQNHGGELKAVPAKPLTFELDLEAMEAAITDKTRVVLINSPNNPSGAVYSAQELDGLADILRKKSAQYGRPIFLASDEPYRFLTFDGAVVPPILPVYEHALVVSSFSKNLSMAGERVGYVALNPSMPGKEQLMNGLVLANRILGYVNAPAIGQQLALKAMGAEADVSVYEARRAAMVEVLDAAGYRYTKPRGGFYFFPEAPGGDDVAFVRALQDELVLAVPGSGFGYPGFFRLTISVEEAIIRRSKEGFTRAMENYAK